MHPTTVHALRDELQKIAESYHEELEALEKKLKPGDIFLAKLRHPGVGGTIIGKTLSAFQEGTDYYHSAIYAGKNKVIDINPGRGVNTKTLRQFADRYQFKALEVKAPTDVKEKAVAYGRKQVGKGYDLFAAIRQALPARSDDGERKRQQGLDGFFCSQLISNAYDKVPFAKHRFIGDIRPVDFQKSPYTKTIGEIS